MHAHTNIHIYYQIWKNNNLLFTTLNFLCTQSSGNEKYYLFLYDENAKISLHLSFY